MSDCPLAHSDAAYVLGSLSPAERLEYERHLPGCAACRSSVAQLAGLPGLLGRVGIETVESTVPEDPVPTSVLPTLVARVRREQRRRTVLVSLGAAAAVAVVALGATALQQAGDDGSRAPVALPSTASPTTPPPMRAMSVLLDWGVTAEVSLAPAGTATVVDFTCTYAERPDGGSHAYRYLLVAYTRDGARHQVMGWWAKPGETWANTTVAPLELDQLTRLEVQNDRGATILQLDV